MSQCVQMTANSNAALRCTNDQCPCDVYSPDPDFLRKCRTCKHGWLSHALTRLTLGGKRCATEEFVRDMASCVLYGTKAIPIRLKMLLDRLLATLNEADADDLLKSLGWTWENYARGYMPDVHQEKSLSRWFLSGDDEATLLERFVHLDETKHLASLMLLNEADCAATASTSKEASSCNNNKAPNNRSNGGVGGGGVPSMSSSLFPSSTAANTLEFYTFLQRQNAAMRNFLAHAQQPKSPFYNINCSPPSGPLFPPLNPFVGSVGRASDISCSDLDGDSSSSQSLSSPGVSISAESQRSFNQPEAPLSPSINNRSHSANAVMSCTQEVAEDLSVKRNQPQVVVVAHELPPKPKKFNSGATKPPNSNIGPFYNPVLSSYYSKTVKNVRKTALKRLHPSSLAQLGTNPLTGKKRVQCRVCMKTFCDKGALKIHISAVHLREMHQCTVAGCNMVFSSRRSRNRHAGNPNPKLHTPTYRRNSLVGGGCRVISPPSAADEYRKMIAELEEPSRSSSKRSSAAHRRSWHSDQQAEEDQLDAMSKSDAGSSVATPTDERSTRVARKRKSDHPTKIRPATGSTFVSAALAVAVDEQPPKSRRKPEPSYNVVDEAKQPSASPVVVAPPEPVAKSPQVPNAMEEILDCNLYTPGDESLSSTTAISQLANMTQNLASTLAAAPKAESLFPSASIPIYPSERKTPSSPPAHQIIETYYPPSNMGGGGGGGGRRSKTPCSNSSDIPLDEENPRKCSACGKIFQNHFSVKTHYQNVHLKVMHKCTVDGCNAKFPSKRSRDRHSGNQNLHRKLLSTSRDPSPVSNGSSTSAPKPLGSAGGGVAFRPEFLPGQLYPFGAAAPMLTPFGAASILPYWAARMAAAGGGPLPPPFFPPPHSEAMNMARVGDMLANGSLNLSAKKPQQRKSPNSAANKAETVK